MVGRTQEVVIVTALLLLAAFVFTFGMTWGLPSRKADALLFGDRKPWTGAEILALAPQQSGGSADVDVNPADRGSILNDTDAKRAEIVRRYRLFTYQPDEMITMMALAGMHPSKFDFDPRLYQYGELWIYPIGGLIKILLHPRADQAYYLDHPEEFGKFYIVARAYSAAWGVVGAWAVYQLMRGFSRHAAILATLLYITMPVVVNMAHEAKPHLPGTVLMILAALAASNYIRRGGSRRLVWMSALCGAAAGMILSAMVAVVIAMAAVILRVRQERLLRGEEHLHERPSAASGEPVEPHSPPRLQGRESSFSFVTGLSRTAVALLIAAAVYGITNPYVIKHLATDRAVLTQNLANTQAMYRFDLLSGSRRAIELLAAGCGWLTLLVAAVGGAASVVFRARSRVSYSPSAYQYVLVKPLLCCAFVIIFQFASLAAGKPGEYGRFGLLVDVTLGMVASAVLTRVSARGIRFFISLVLVGCSAGWSGFYLAGFEKDSWPTTSRDRRIQVSGNQELGLPDEPAPYLMPAVNLWDWKLVLLPKSFDLATSPPLTQVVLRPIDTPTQAQQIGRYHRVGRGLMPLVSTPISWADKPIEFWQRDAAP